MLSENTSCKAPSIYSSTRSIADLFLILILMGTAGISDSENKTRFRSGAMIVTLGSILLFGKLDEVSTVTVMVGDAEELLLVSKALTNIV